MRPRNTSQSVAFRCDGHPGVGAGHVGRCVPLAAAFRDRGWQASFVGRLEGLARHLIEAEGFPCLDPDPGAPCGLVDSAWQAAVLDCYALAKQEICELGRTLQLATVAESPGCTGAAVHVDFHVDRLHEPATQGLL